MKGWLIYNHSLHTDKFQEVHKLYQLACGRYGVKLIEIANDQLLFSLINGEVTLLNQEPFPDFVVFLDKDIYLAKKLEEMGIKVFNSSESIRVCDNKIETMDLLNKAGIPIPNTVVAPLAFAQSGDMSYEEQIVKTLGLPCVIKEAYGSFGEQVYLARSLEEVKQISQSIGNKPYLYQEFIGTSEGRDLRVYVAFGEVVFGVKRRNTKDFRANVTNGGTMEAYPVNEAIEQLAIQASATLGTDFAGVDILFGPGDTPIVCEVNSNAHIKNALEVSGVNFAEHIIKGIIKACNHSRKF